MLIRKVKITKEKLGNLIVAIRNIPDDPIGDHLTDDEFIRYAIEELSEDELKRIDQHLESCDECAAGAERLIEESEVWQGEQGKKRLAVIRKRCLFARTLSQAAENFYQSELLVADDGATRKICDWHDDMLRMSVTQDTDGNWIFWFSSYDLELMDKKFYLKLVSSEYEVVLKRVTTQDEVGAMIVVPRYERPDMGISKISFDLDKQSFSIQSG